MQEISTKPYLLRALYEWCTDNGFTPHIAAKVDNRTRVPRQFVRDGEIVLNISFDATSQLQMGNDVIEFLARFSGKSHKIEVPVSNILAIYARENGQGMAFPVEGVPQEPVEGAPEFEALAADEFYDMTPKEKQRVLRERVLQQAGQSGPATVGRDVQRGQHAEGPIVQGPDAGEAAGEGRKDSSRKHLKVIK
ncbi:ClpXP protease specificity-enhancing factor [Mycetohabitans sp. B5]|uniref:Stringent starvation protein B n=1 Tax=Mycetohabitans endofungorum TaxID=417203 RepID=A0A2P5K946_9BURK|nr:MULTISPECIES: ClpXP protease specificity-enhancing factor [Mycetohabitans]MCG1054211.1 ClpXP protease specificity-enhancing factor [Mycetohabitans sp. B5]PPB83234.1 stringent starvation protein B [Mycetohabitans endofungorum]QGY72815.1 ClpXP protease specificity-enhancing factor SspB [Mycetohabitans endofungorum]